MISNNTSYKLKASKSSKDVHDYQDNPLEDNYDSESVDGDATGDSNRRYNYYTSRDGRYKGGRSRNSEYKVNRSSERERRTSYRGRGTVSLRRSEREFAEGGYGVARKQDSLSRSYELSGSYHHPKTYEGDKKTEVKFNLPEDIRISKLLRRLSLENNQDFSLTISKKLLEVLMLPDNALYVRKAFNILGESVLEILQVAPGPQAKSQAARCLGRMAYIMGQENDFERYQKWMFSKMQSGNDDINYLFMVALKECLIFERKKSVLLKHAMHLIKELTQALELVENVKVFKATLDNVMSLAEMYPDEFYPQLRDIADVLIGWHVDSSQTLSTIQFISENLQRISRHFQSNLEFSVTMVIHFLEDIATYRDQLHKKEHDSDEITSTTESTSIEHTTLFILALNTVLKCLGDKFKACTNDYVTDEIVIDCLTQIIDTAVVALEAFVPDNLTIAANECISVLLTALNAKPNAINDSVFNLIDLELSLTQEFSDGTIVSMLLMISVAIRELSANVPMELVPKLVGPQSEVIKLRYSRQNGIQEAVIILYQSLLNVKNIPFLQEAYRFILGDFEFVYKQLVPNVNLMMQPNPFLTLSCPKEDVEFTLMFLLRCLSALATLSGSIICMWAIQPSIVDFLSRVLEPLSASFLPLHCARSCGSASANPASSTLVNSASSNSGLVNSTLTNSGLTHSGLASSALTTSGLMASGLTTIGLATSGLATSGLATSGLATSGLATSGLSISGLSISGLPSSGLTTSGLNTSGLITSGLTTSGLNTSGLTTSGLTISGATTSGLATSGLTIPGLTTSGLPTSGLTISPLTNSDLSNTTLTNSSLTHSALSNSALMQSALPNSSLTHSALSNSAMTNSSLTNSALSNSALSNSTLAQSALTNSTLSNSTLSNSTLSNCALSNSALSNSTLSNSTLSNSALPNSALTNSSLSNSALSNSALSNSALPNPALTNSASTNSVFPSSTLTNSTLTDSTFSISASLNPPSSTSPLLNSYLLDPSTNSFSPSLNPSPFNPSSFDPLSFDPSSFDPSSFDPSSFDPSSFDPSSFDPTSFDPSAFDPSCLNPSAFDPSSFNPSSFNPSSFNAASFNSSFNPPTFNSSTNQPSVNSSLNPTISSSVNPSFSSSMNPSCNSSFNPAANISSSFNSSANPSFFNPSSCNPSSFNPSSFNPSTFNPSSLNPSSFNTSLDPSSFNPSSNPSSFNPSASPFKASPFNSSFTNPLNPQLNPSLTSSVNPSLTSLNPSSTPSFNPRLKSSSLRSMPALHYSLLYILYSHCKRYQFYVSISDLVVDVPNSKSLHVVPETFSSNAGNFTVILKILLSSLSCQTDCETKLFLLQWFGEILATCETFMERLYNQEIFGSLAKVLVQNGYTKSDPVILAVHANLNELLSNKQLAWKNTFLGNVSDLCALHMKSNNEAVRKAYSKLYLNIPWDIAIVEFAKIQPLENIIHKDINLNGYNNYTLALAQHLHINGTVYGEMQPLHFKTLMKYLLNNEPLVNQLEDIFVACWPTESESQTEEFRDLALNSRVVLNNWVTWEAAQLCINTKLRTPLGKPNETFTSFETSIKQLAKDVMRCKSDLVGLRAEGLTVRADGVTVRGDGMNIKSEEIKRMGTNVRSENMNLEVAKSDLVTLLTKPDGLKSDLLKSDLPKSDLLKPVLLKSDLKSDLSKSDLKSDLSKSDLKSDLSKSNLSKSDLKSDHSKSDLSKSDLKSDLSKSDPTQSNHRNSDASNSRTSERSAEADLNLEIVDQRRVRLLLQFMEHLEISIYNAAEGCAFAIPQCPKPVRTFFSTNASTCREWLSRIRLMLVQLALHAGQSTIAYRHAEAFLRDLVANNKTKTLDFEVAVMYAAIALLNLRESKALHGLHTWCLKVAHRSFDWLKPAIDQANKKFESALVGYESVFEKINSENSCASGISGAKLEDGVGNVRLRDRKFSDHNLGDQKLGDHNLGDRKVGDHNLGGHKVGDHTSLDRKVGDHGNPKPATHEQTVQKPGDQKLKTHENRIKTFLGDQIIACYKEMHAWQSIVDWDTLLNLCLDEDDSNIRYSFRTITVECARNLVAMENVDNEHFNKENFNKENFNRENFNKENFNKENFNKENFNKENFSMEKFNMGDFNMENVNMENDNMENFNMENFNMENINMENVNMENVNMDNFNMKNVNMENFNMENFGVEHFNMETFNMENPNMENFNLENTQAYHSLSKWDDLSNSYSSPNSWSTYDKLITVENELYNVAFNVSSTNKLTRKSTLEKVGATLSVIENTIQDDLLALPSDYMQYFCLLNYVSNGLKNILHDDYTSVFLVSEDFENEINKIDSTVLSKVLWWSEYFASVQKNGFNMFCNNLRLNIVKKARKEKNIGLACAQLYKFLADKELLRIDETNESLISVTQMNSQLSSGQLNVNLLSPNQLNFNHGDVNEMNTGQINGGQTNGSQINTNQINTNQINANIINTNLINTNQINPNLLNANQLNYNQTNYNQTNYSQTNKNHTNKSHAYDNQTYEAQNFATQRYNYPAKKHLLLKDVSNSLIQAIPDVSVWTVDSAKAVTEVIKLLYDDPDSKSLTFNLCAVASTNISKFGQMHQRTELLQTSSRILLKLATWLQTNDQVSLTELNSPLGKFLMVLPEIGIADNTHSATHSNIIPMNEMAIGKLLQFSVAHCVTLAKAWNAFGTWCYRWGRKVVDSSYDLATTLTEEDRIVIQNILPRDATDEDLNRVYKILSQSRSAVEDEDIDSNEINTSEMIFNQLQNIPVLRNYHDLQLQELVLIWRKIQKRIYAYYELSAEAYFKYLHLTTNAENLSKSTEYNTVTVTLRLLRLIVRHALELQTVLEAGLATTPTHPWKVIIPQLFSRLNHPEIYVRQRVSELLCRVAEDAPHLITFPAVVGALEGGVKFDFSEISLPKDCLSQTNDNNEDVELNDDDIYDSDNEDSKNVLRACFKSMVDTLTKQAPVTITQVQLLVKELRRIILLWDELWLGTLAQHQSEITKRQQQLEIEIEKVNENPNLNKEEKISLITEKHRIIIKPIIYILEQLCDITSAEPETPHEHKFQERYSEIIKDVVGKLKNPENPDKPQKSWKLIKLLQTKFQQKSNKRTSYSLKMQEISPVLYNLMDTVISMPGLTTSSRQRVTIAKLANNVTILPTKTKPKKLVFHGSDGQTYTYLFKGLEDLHLDERIMQFLSIANTMMAQISDGTDHNLYRARHYSVIPLGPRSGLISWVDGTTPLFALYKRWQQREATKTNAKSNATPTVLRPSDLFYNKLNPLLQESGIKNVENRKEWPLSVLKNVLTDLMAETPNDLLAKELWCHSINAGSWWQMVRKYTYSVAVMSIIGYIIGLGDRHLDNVLIDLTSGEVVHIDYNVCFEKGKTLRVPEKVPFRLTPNIQEALGVTGVEGIFRLSCENVLRTMKKGRETLLTLLEAFVYDPLVDWTVGGEGLAGTTFGGVTSTSSRQSRKNLEREVTFSMFNVRCTELKVDWLANRDSILEEIPKITRVLNDWSEENKKTRHIEDLLQDLHQQMGLVKEAEANGVSKHPLYSLPSRYESFRKTKDILIVAKQNVNSMVSDCELHLQKYSDAIKTIQSPDFTQWLLELNVNYDYDSVRVFDLAKEFLQNAGQINMVTQCEQSENEAGQLAHQQSLGTIKCIQLLQEYEAVLTQCPATYLEKHRSFCFLKWFKYLIEMNEPTACDIVFHQFIDLVEAKNYPYAKVITKFAYHIKILYAEMVQQLAKYYEEFSKFHNDNALEKVYTDAKYGISNFLKKEKGALKAFEFVLVGELLVLNKSFLQLETAASRSGDWLIALKGRDGDWYLDELAYSSYKALEFINYLPVQQNSKLEDTKYLQVVSGLHSCNNIYKVLQELNINFHTIILPESMRKIQSEEPSVLHMVVELNNIIRSVGMPLAEVVNQLEKKISCIVMEMDNTPTFDFIMEKVNEMKLHYKDLLVSLPDHHHQGKMLLMGFSGLFEKLNIEMNNLISTIGGIDIPLCWRKIDQVNEAKSMAIGAIYNMKIRAVLDDIFFVKRLQTMSEFFSLCSEMCQSFAGFSPNVVVLNDEQLTKPIKKFISDFIGRQFLGITTEMNAYVICFLLQHLGLDVTNEIEQKDIGAENKVPLDDIYHKGYGAFVKNGLFTQNVAAQASSLVSNLKTAWDKLQDPKKLNHNITLLKSSVVRIQNQMTAHNWLYEDILSQTPMTQSTCTFVKSKFILDLRNEAASLNSVYCKLQESKEQQKNLIGSVGQRLRWAAGANPDLNEVLSAFEGAVSTRETRLEMELNVTSVVVNICNVILHHELLRSVTPEASNYDKLFVSTFEKWKTACESTGVEVDAVLPVEENIMRLYVPEMANNAKWVSILSEKISEQINGNHKELHEQKMKTMTAYDLISKAIGEFKGHYSQHCKLMSDFKNLIKSMAKIEECACNAQEFILNYRNYIANFSGVFHHYKNDGTVEEIAVILEHLVYLEKNTGFIYGSLMDLEVTDSLQAGGKPSRSELGYPGRSSGAKQENHGRGQQRNTYAVNVWRRVRMKLEGRDPEPGKKYSIQEQVDYVIREATSLDNLALLYEGWTPWV